MSENLKNVILISDSKGSTIDSLLSTNKFHIKMVIVPYEDDVKYLKEKYGNFIDKYLHYVHDTNEDFQNYFKSDYNLKYTEIEKFRATQLKVYRYNSRFICDDNTNNCIYYTALKFFLGYFNDNKIDCVISRIMEHGSISDTVIFDIAKNYNIPVFIFFQNSNSGMENLLSVLDYNKKEFIDLSSVEKKVNIENLLSVLSKNYSNNKWMNYPFSKLLTKFFAKKHSLVECIKWFWQYRVKVYMRHINYTSIDDLYKIREETSITQMIKGHFYFSKLKRFYNKNSIDKIEDEHYIFFPLHLEPEASIMARTTLNCQLFIIEQIAKTLPDGWKLYVKEHPDQFAMVMFDKYMHKSVYNFRNIDFYKRISKIKNVKMISLKVPSSLLINNMDALTSISGSAILESIAKQKPVIVWGDGSNFIEMLNDTLLVKGFDDLLHAYEKLKSGFKPSYNDYESIMNKYCFSINTNDFYNVDKTTVNILNLIYNSIVNNSI